MPLLHSIVVILFLCCAATTSAQKSTWTAPLKDPNVVWVADFEEDYRFVPMRGTYSCPSFINDWNTLSILKVSQPEDYNKFSTRHDKFESYWGEEMRQKLTTFAQGSFEDQYLLQPYVDSSSFARFNFQRIDTITIIDVENFQEDFAVPKAIASAESIVGIRALHRIYLNKKTGKIGLEIRSWSPLVLYDYYYDRTNVIIPSIWFEAKKAKSSDKKMLKSSKIEWAVETKSFNRKPLLKDLIVRKGSFEPEQYFANMFYSKKDELYSTFYCNKPLSDTEVNDLQVKMDTVMTIHPETFETSFEINTKNPMDNIVHLQVVVRWYWDERKKELYYKFVGYTPFNERMPLFYVLNK